MEVEAPQKFSVSIVLIDNNNTLQDIIVQSVESRVLKILKDKNVESTVNIKLQDTINYVLKFIH